MPRGKSVKPRLVAVDQVPKTVRRGVYVDLVDEFAKSDMKTAKVEGVNVSAAVSVKKAVASLGLKNVSVATANGEVYLTRE
jgi:hypothetical protein